MKINFELYSPKEGSTVLHFTEAYDNIYYKYCGFDKNKKPVETIKQFKLPNLNGEVIDTVKHILSRLYMDYKAIYIKGLSDDYLLLNDKDKYIIGCLLGISEIENYILNNYDVGVFGEPVTSYACRGLGVDVNKLKNVECYDDLCTLLLDDCVINNDGEFEALEFIFFKS